MAVYGLSLYGQDVYGLPGYGARAGRGFSAAYVTAEPTGVNDEGRYGQVLLAWDPPVGNWTDLRIMRQFSGFPTSIFEGTLVHESLKENKVNRLVDTDLKAGVAAYYSLFVQAAGTDVWYRSGGAWALVVEDHDFHTLLQDALPDAALRGDHEASQILPEERKYPLLRFLEVPAFELDRAKTSIKTLDHLYDPYQTPAAAVPLLTKQFGITPEASIGVARLRSIAQNATYLNAKRGTQPGVEALASVFTGWGATVTTGANLMLRDDLANWSTTNDTASIVDATETVADSQFGVVMGDANAVPLRSGDVDGRERFYAVPVQPETDYTLSLSAQYGTTARDVTPRVRHYDVDGAFLSETTGTAFQGGDGTWGRGTYTFTTPADTAFTEVAIDLAGGADTEEHYFKDIQLEEGSSATSYEPPRQAVVTFEAPFTNFITTPSFEDGVTPAFTVTNASTAFDSTLARSGTDSWVVTPTTLGTDTVVESTDLMPVQVGDPALLLASLYPQADVTVTATVRWLDGSMDVVHDHSDSFDLVANEWGDIDLSCECALGHVTIGQAPGEAQHAQFVLTWQDVTVNMDAVALVDSYGIDYFDGDSLEEETLWDGGSAHNGQSYYYPMKPAKEDRLSAVLPNFLPLNRSFTLKYADSV